MISVSFTQRNFHLHTLCSSQFLEAKRWCSSGLERGQSVSQELLDYQHITPREMGMVENEGKWLLEALQTSKFYARNHPRSKRRQYVWTADASINSEDVKKVFDELVKHGQAVHINTGIQEGPESKTSSVTSTYSGFIKEDHLKTWMRKNTSYQMVTKDTHPMRPVNANHVIDAWSHSAYHTIEQVREETEEKARRYTHFNKSKKCDENSESYDGFMNEQGKVLAIISFLLGISYLSAWYHHKQMFPRTDDFHFDDPPEVTPSELEKLYFLREAPKDMDDVVRVIESMVSKEPFKIIWELEEIGYFYYGRKTKITLMFYLEALKIRKESFGEKHRSLDAPLRRIGKVYACLRNYDEALKYHLQALEIRKELQMEQPSTESYFLTNIAQILQIQEKYAKAFEYYLSALSFSFQGSQSCELKHETLLLDTMNCLKEIEDETKRQKGNEELLHLCINKLGENHKSTQLVKSAFIERVMGKSSGH